MLCGRACLMSMPPGCNLAWAQVYTKINVAAVRKYLANAIYKTKKIMRPWLLQGPGAIRSGRYGLHANDTTGPHLFGQEQPQPALRNAACTRRAFAYELEVKTLAL